MAEPYNGLTVGQKVRIVQQPKYKGSPTNSQRLAVGTEGFITKLADDDEEWRFTKVERTTHVVFNTESGKKGGGTWMDSACLEAVDQVGEREIEDALKSISEAAKHQEHVLMFKSITVVDGSGKELTIRVEGQQVYVSDEYDEDLFTLTVDSWINMQEVVDLAFRQINPTHVGKEK